MGLHVVSLRKMKTEAFQISEELHELCKRRHEEKKKAFEIVELMTMNIQYTEEYLLYTNSAVIFLGLRQSKSLH